MNTFSDILRRLENIVRVGTVAEVDVSDAAAPRVRVQDGGLLTHWLPFGTARTGKVKTFSAPTVGEQVVMLSPSGDTAAAVVICGLYCTASPAPSTDPHEHITTFEDGTHMSYNDNTGLMVFSGMRDVLIKASGSVTIDAPSTQLNGTVAHNGAGLSSNGVTLDTHLHKDVRAGVEKSGAPVK